MVTDAAENWSMLIGSNWNWLDRILTNAISPLSRSFSSLLPLSSGSALSALSALSAAAVSALHLLSAIFAVTFLCSAFIQLSEYLIKITLIVYHLDYQMSGHGAWDEPRTWPLDTQ